MKKNILLLLFAIAAMSSRAQPPNNLIFNGGNGDGAAGFAYAIAANTIFTGSEGDGTAQASNNNIANQLFLGGGGDGISATSNAAVSNTIFLGSEGDGFATQSNNAVSNNIFLGSEGDGFSNNTNAALPNNIFIGGEGDGWHAVILPMGPLPVKLLSFTADHSGSAHLVKWITTEEINTHHFEVERSANGRDFTSLGNVSPAGGSSTGAAYSFMVLQPRTGNNFYRLKITDNDGSVTYSNIILLKNMEGLQLAVYPNPAADVLYVRIPVMSSTAPVNAKLYDVQGKLVMQPVFKTGFNNEIRVDRLPAGSYTLHCIIDQQPFVCRFIKTR